MPSYKVVLASRMEEAHSFPIRITKSDAKWRDLARAELAEDKIAYRHDADPCAFIGSHLSAYHNVVRTTFDTILGGGSAIITSTSHAPNEPEQVFFAATDQGRFEGTSQLSMVERSMDFNSRLTISSELMNGIETYHNTMNHSGLQMGHVAAHNLGQTHLAHTLNEASKALKLIRRVKKPDFDRAIESARQKAMNYPGEANATRRAYESFDDSIVNIYSEPGRTALYDAMNKRTEAAVNYFDSLSNVTLTHPNRFVEYMFSNGGVGQSYRRAGVTSASNTLYNADVNETAVHAAAHTRVREMMVGLALLGDDNLTVEEATERVGWADRQVFG